MPAIAPIPSALVVALSLSLFHQEETATEPRTHRATATTTKAIPYTGHSQPTSCYVLLEPLLLLDV